MAIMAVLMLLGGSSLLSARDQYIANQAAEIAISATREAQNRAISFMQSEGNSPTKVWGVSFLDTENEIRIVSIDENGLIHDEETKDININVDIINKNSTYIFFSSPFGTPYVIQGSCGNSVWTEHPRKPSKEYYPAGCTYLEGNEKDTVSFEYKGHSFNVSIDSNGGVTIE